MQTGPLPSTKSTPELCHSASSTQEVIEQGSCPNPHQTEALPSTASLNQPESQYIGQFDPISLSEGSDQEHGKMEEFAIVLAELERIRSEQRDQIDIVVGVREVARQAARKGLLMSQEQVKIIRLRQETESKIAYIECLKKKPKVNMEESEQSSQVDNEDSFFHHRLQELEHKKVCCQEQLALIHEKGVVWSERIKGKRQELDRLMETRAKQQLTLHLLAKQQINDPVLQDVSRQLTLIEQKNQHYIEGLSIFIESLKDNNT